MKDTVKSSLEDKLEYVQSGECLIPKLKLSDQEDTPLGKYGRMRKAYLKEHRPIIYNHMLLRETLYPHLREIDQTARERLEQMMPELAKEAGATEQLKASDPMKWVGLMNNCKAQAEEILKAELIYN
ncbi:MULTISPECIES: TnpV protein [unclassified Pseudoflavonifractor]|uniref:TnpV protein n=1 Tax=unclassified Pseudoflavonifractor TaxID=2628103 RepID=UPI001FA92B57|nr:MULTISPECIES: TnpV protein [unclassified Pseudoflavonifractor]